MNRQATGRTCARSPLSLARGCVRLYPPLHLFLPQLPVPTTSTYPYCLSSTSSHSAGRRPTRQQVVRVILARQVVVHVSFCIDTSFHSHTRPVHHARPLRSLATGGMWQVESPYAPHPPQLPSPGTFTQVHGGCQVSRGIQNIFTLRLVVILQDQTQSKSSPHSPHSVQSWLNEGRVPNNTTYLVR